MSNSALRHHHSMKNNMKYRRNLYENLKGMSALDAIACVKIMDDLGELNEINIQHA